MSAALLAFFILMGAAHTDTLVRGRSSVLQGRDPSVQNNTYETPVEYILTTAPWRTARADAKGGCNFTILARANGRGAMRLNIGRKEQILDTSWAFKTRLDGGEKMTMEAWFIEPIGGATAAYRTTTFKCGARDTRPVYRAPDMSGVL